jgi:hypothetical protein
LETNGITHIMQLVKVGVSAKLPSVLLDVVQVYRVARHGITMTCGMDAPPAKLLCLLVCQVPCCDRVSLDFLAKKVHR